MKAAGQKRKVRRRESRAHWDATHLRRGYGAPSIEGKGTRVGATERGSERLSMKKRLVSTGNSRSGGNRIGAIARIMGAINAA